MVGSEGTAPPPNSSENVPPGHSLGMERGRANDPPRLLTWPPTPRPSGGPFCCPISGVPEHQREDSKPSPPSL